MINFDSQLTTYTLIIFFLIAVCSLLFFNFFLNHISKEFKIWPWAILFVVLFAIVRYPFITYNYELEVDESQMLAQALSLRKYGVYWDYVDGLTQGPLTIYFLIIPTWLGMEFDYFSARVLGFAVLNITLLLNFLTIQNFFSRKNALIVFIPVALFHLLNQGFYVALCNEYLVLLLLAIDFWLFSILYRQVQPSFSLVFVLALTAGMIPFAKLQGVPNALVIILFAAFLVLSRSKNKFRGILILCLGGVSFPLLVLGLVIHFDVFNYFWNFYLIGNTEYAGEGTIWNRVLDFPNFLKHSGQFVFFISSFTILIGSIIIILLKSGRWKNLHSFIFLFSISQLITSFYSIIKSGYYFQHYLYFLILPIALFTAVLLARFEEPALYDSKKIEFAAFAWLTACLVPYLVHKGIAVLSLPSPGYPTISVKNLGKPLRISPVASEINKHVLPGDDITIWGWKPSYHLETRQAQGTGDVMVYRLLTPAPKQSDYIKKYLDDLSRNKPAVFVDEIKKGSVWFGDPEKWRHENVEAVRNFINLNYDLVTTIDEERIYVRKDRLRAVSAGSHFQNR